MTEPTPTTNQNEAEIFSFKAETKQLLNILIHSLYKDREVFLRELLSNASDALNRMRFEMLTEHQVLDAGVELRIHITADKEKRLLTIQDTGIGMTRDEIIENLGTIAQSGARKFMEATQDKKDGFFPGDRPVRSGLLLGFHGGRMGAGDQPLLQATRQGGQLVCHRRGQFRGRRGGNERSAARRSRSSSRKMPPSSPKNTA